MTQLMRLASMKSIGGRRKMLDEDDAIAINNAAELQSTLSGPIVLDCS